MKYHIWTIGCQMNSSDSLRVAAALEARGYEPTEDLRQADVVVLNTCVVRQSAEDRASGFLWSLKPLKERRPSLVIALMGCMVGVRGNGRLRERFPHVDVLMPPGDVQPLLIYLDQRLPEERIERCGGDDTPVLPDSLYGQLVSVPVPVVLGCNLVCSYCVIPSRRGRERSRNLEVILSEVEALAQSGVREVVLLGQIVDRYGYDLGAEAPRLPDLLAAVSEVEGIARVRFLTSHPNYFDDRLIEAVRTLPKVCEHIEVPIQAGDDVILQRMRRSYSVDDYRRLIERIRARVPECSIATDVIVGFPGETEQQFQNTLRVLAELEMDVCHVAMYSPRPGTLAATTMVDDVPPEEKKRRLDAVNALQEEIAARINHRLLGQRVEILVEGQQKGKWKGRTRTNKLVFFSDDSGRDWHGELVEVVITWTGPWSMQAELATGHSSEAS
ncbi:MAG: tRNA (N6-isopentenyl adenosine(37)-C2)-methylthiotransferase MiaB [Anaerolineae bacterium]|nr:tRNA (N6-isopentenyl adenosine(37)-C2)-methylthiotransferase MiaB [Anaerolineae bacterium]MDW8070589.1 tRNA (N6-isopentenyl adenosine(37)-C2)-methylthiotransferase MiaB [Anaerolineae bacterium]